MPKKRIIGGLLLSDGWVVQSVAFSRYLPVGRPDIAARFLNDWGVDEILLLDISASAQGRTIDPHVVERVSSSCFVPLAVGGGIRSTDNVRDLIRAGADKVAINTAAVQTPRVLSDSAQVFGDQCIVAAMDVRSIVAGHEVVVASGQQGTGLDPAALARTWEMAGAGEILVNSIDRDGSKAGFDLEAVNTVANAVHLPVIAMGGAGKPAHVSEVLGRENISAAAIGNMLHFTEHSATTLKQWLAEAGMDVRREAAASYDHINIDGLGRLGKLPDEQLAQAVFEYITKEVI